MPYRRRRLSATLMQERHWYVLLCPLVLMECAVNYSWAESYRRLLQSTGYTLTVLQPMLVQLTLRLRLIMNKAHWCVVSWDDLPDKRIILAVPKLTCVHNWGVTRWSVISGQNISLMLNLKFKINVWHVNYGDLCTFRGVYR